jgi:hypothetical protein
LSRNESGRIGALKSDSTHHFFRNTCPLKITSFWNYILHICNTVYYILSSNKGIFVWPIWPEVNCPYFHTDSTHHFFRNTCIKSGSLRFSQFSGCWLILSVYIIMSFDFLFVRLYLYTFSLCENASFIIVSAETEYISTRSWYRNINFLRDRIRRICS